MSKQNSGFFSTSNLVKIISGIILTVAGFYISGWVKPILLYKFGCETSPGCQTIVCSDIYAGSAVFISGLTILLYTFAKGLLISVMNLIRTIQGKNPIMPGPGGINQ